jgi:hypothetical protein
MMQKTSKDIENNVSNVWGDVVGKVTKRRGDKVFVQWESTSFPIEERK